MFCHPKLLKAAPPDSDQDSKSCKKKASASPLEALLGTKQEQKLKKCLPEKSHTWCTAGGSAVTATLTRGVNKVVCFV
ncbi:hypothetical protein CHARACLAT_012272 [Characodon lateralis]|uniref:Uncharacterized protein n=1 Tax=Characodon lateralis TaxID=208331 RepID=A0ABU7CYX4_9TELE|nr:hypothetical protein [Characodon lateralis]